MSPIENATNFCSDTGIRRSLFFSSKDYIITILTPRNCHWNPGLFAWLDIFNNRCLELIVQRLGTTFRLNSEWYLMYPSQARQKKNYGWRHLDKLRITDWISFWKWFHLVFIQDWKTANWFKILISLWPLIKKRIVFSLE